MSSRKFNMSSQSNWLGLMIGNSRLHWANFSGASINITGDSKHLQAWDDQQLPDWLENSSLPLAIASVVPSQTEIWQNYCHAHLITLQDIPLQGIYPTLGIDRALAIWGAGTHYGWPILVIDAGTALTFTGADQHQYLQGGAILPGVKLQFASLAEKTAALPTIDCDLIDSSVDIPVNLSNLPVYLPERWARNTPDAMHSGVIYTLLASIRDYVNTWLIQFPDSYIVITGGDRTLLLNYLKIFDQGLGEKIIETPHAIFWGMAAWQSSIHGD
jgi:type III pantothenate kinase